MININQKEIKVPTFLQEKNDLIGLGVVLIKKDNNEILFIKGIKYSFLEILIDSYHNDIIRLKSGNFFDNFSIYTIYIHFFEFKKSEIIVVFYVSDDKGLIINDNLYALSYKLINCYNEDFSEAKINALLKEIFPTVEGVAGVFIIKISGHSLFTKVNKNLRFLEDNSVQIGGFISAFLIFSKEILKKISNEEYIRAINFDKFDFIIHENNDIIFAFLLRKDKKIFDIERYIELIKEEFYIRYGDLIREFNGKVTNFNEFESVIEKYFII